MRLELPIPPSANRYWAYVRGRVIPSEEARRYKNGVKLRALTLGLRKPFDCEVCVSIAIYRPRRAGDLDNYQKCLFDALQGVAYINDSQIAEIHALRLEDPAQPRVVVTVEPMTAKPPRPR